jgi:hypothetical protein
MGGRKLEQSSQESKGGGETILVIGQFEEDAGALFTSLNSS